MILKREDQYQDDCNYNPFAVDPGEIQETYREIEQNKMELKWLEKLSLLILCSAVSFILLLMFGG
jgi:hypothetical protein